MKFFLLWFAFLAFVLLYFRFSSIGKSRWNVFQKYAKLRYKKILTFSFIFFLLLFSGIESFHLLSNSKETKSSFDSYKTYSLDLLKSDSFSPFVTIEDSSAFFCFELVAIVPTAIKTLFDISGKNIVPLLKVQNEKQIFLQIKGFHSFKNRGIKTKKLLQKRLGKNYIVEFSESAHGAFLSITYKGAPWKKDEVLALPTAVAARQYGVLPEHLLSFYATLYPLDSLNLLERFPPDSIAHLFKEAMPAKDDSTMFAYTIRKALPSIAKDSAMISVYASIAKDFSKYFKKYGF